jgi:hypothetical protein
MQKLFKKWFHPLFNRHNLAQKNIFWVIEESEVFSCCTAIKFYNQVDELLHCEEMKGIDYKNLDEDQIKKLNQKAQQILLNKL